MNDSGMLAGTTALVTGGAKRLGRAIALELADAGASVVVHYRSSSQAAGAVAAEIERLGREAWAVQGDLAAPEGPAAVWQQAAELAGEIHWLVNNASIFEPSSVMDFDRAELDRNVHVNAVAPLELCRLFASQGVAGAIVNLLDSRVADYDHEHAAYHLAKRMLYSLTRMLAVELAPNVRVNGVAPGLILPPPGEDESYLEEMAHTNPLNTHGSGVDVGEAVRYLLSATFVTGQVIYVDGGRHLKGCMYG